ncbi:AP2 domain-containing protein (plasmid) [Desulfocapsa sulfexigens DSM 10523]|uniref:AP2 domain-containing protein n=1 Tax=Desulfocapsa sulfexigens (strain DSM 10523 / SB164P1) TaxID=1167006 RepID=M1NKH3_DESSD|nr:AP2 domain-containing protein [Desulfocapsa sulfexigens]AGF80089.1 AP2 domain-containing protein [Desulfocapsa sulfexigens DSM 10523]
METKEQQLTAKEHKDIARIDQDAKHTHGWYVRIRFQGKTKTKFFSDKKCGGSEIALDLAISWRNTTEKSLGKIRTDKRLVTTTNTGTGVVGVRLNEKTNKYDVSWLTPEGKQGKTSVSIRKHGKEAAFIRACTIRHEKERLRLGGDY